MSKKQLATSGTNAAGAFPGTSADAAAHGPRQYGMDPLLPLRVAFGSAFAPAFDQQGLNIATGKAGLGAAKGCYWVLNTSKVALVDAMHLLFESAKLATNFGELCARFQERAIETFTINPSLRWLVLAFEPDLPSADSSQIGAMRRLNAMRNSCSQDNLATSMYAQLLRSSAHYRRIMRQLLNYLVEDMPLRPHLQLVVSGLSHLRGNDQMRVPMCVRVERAPPTPQRAASDMLAEHLEERARLDRLEQGVEMDGTQPTLRRLASTDGLGMALVAPPQQYVRVVSTPTKALRLDQLCEGQTAVLYVPDGANPAQQAHWYSGSYSALSQLKYWALLMMYYGPHQNRSIIVYSESTQCAVELMCLYDEYLQERAIAMSKDEEQGYTSMIKPSAAEEQEPDDVEFVSYEPIKFYHLRQQFVAGHRAQVIKTAYNAPFGPPPVTPQSAANAPLDKAAPVMVPEQVEVSTLVLHMGQTVGPIFQRLGMSATTAWMFAMWLREHEQHPTPLVRAGGPPTTNTCNPYQLWMAMLRYAEALPPHGSANSTVIVVDRIDSIGAALSPVSVEVRYAPMCALLAALESDMDKENDVTGGSGSKRLSQGQLRAHAARLSYWLSQLYNAHRPGALRVDACRATAVPLYGYALSALEKDKEGDVRRCEPIASMPPTDQRQTYSVAPI